MWQSWGCTPELSEEEEPVTGLTVTPSILIAEPQASLTTHGLIRGLILSPELVELIEPLVNNWIVGLRGCRRLGRARSQKVEGSHTVRSRASRRTISTKNISGISSGNISCRIGSSIITSDTIRIIIGCNRAESSLSGAARSQQDGWNRSPKRDHLFN